MHAAAAAGFLSGSGIEASQMRTVLLSIAIGFVFIFAAWVMVQVIEALNDDRAENAKIIRSTVFLGIIISLLVYLLLKK